MPAVTPAGWITRTIDPHGNGSLIHLHAALLPDSREPRGDGAEGDSPGAGGALRPVLGPGRPPAARRRRGARLLRPRRQRVPPQPVDDGDLRRGAAPDPGRP